MPLTRSRSVAGEVVLVTGAASGIGRAIAHVFAAEGARVAVTDRDEDGVARVAGEITADGATAAGWVLDVSDPRRIAAVVGEVGERLGPVDVFVNNAGVSIPAPLGSPDFDEAWETTFAVIPVVGGLSSKFG